MVYDRAFYDVVVRGMIVDKEVQSVILLDDQKKKCLNFQIG